MSKLAQIEALRIRRHEARKSPPEPKAVKVAKAKALANAAPLANTPTTYKHRDPDKRRAYQRDLMKRRRAKGTPV